MRQIPAGGEPAAYAMRAREAQAATGGGRQPLEL
jgi:hypothetical protein